MSDDIRRDAMLATMRLMERTGDMTMTDLCSGLERLGFDLMNADRATAARKVTDLVKDDPEAACILLEGLVLMCGCAKTFEAAKKEADSYASRATRGGQGRSSASVERDALICCVYFLLALAIFVAILASRGGSS